MQKTKASDPHRESCRRQHRVIGNYLAMEAWLSGVDCIVLERSDLERFLQLERFKSTRVKWLLEDLRPWFSYQEPYYRTSSPSSIHSLYLSRVPITAHLPKGPMTTALRINRMGEDAPKTMLFSKVPSRKLHDEKKIVAQLAQLASGLVAPPRRARRSRRSK
jgi:hypothetical protein